MSKIIQVFKPYFRVNETLSEIEKCLEKGWTGIGFKTEEFEEKWKSYSGYKNAHFLNSATAGLHLAIHIFKNNYNWQDGDEIITTSLTFVSTNHAILYENLAPVFADIDNSLCLDPKSVLRMIGPKTRAVMYVGLGGNAQNYQQIKKICEDNKLIFILDAAHMAGTSWKNSREQVGLDADCSIYSFQAVKNCPSSDSGMICFKDQKLDGEARKLAWLGIDKSTYNRYSESSYKWRYNVDSIGFKYHGNSISASLCLISLKYLEEDNMYRREIAKIYSEKFENYEKIEIIKHSNDINSSQHLFQIAVGDRDKLIENLARKNIYCGVHYIPNCQYSIYSQFKRSTKNAVWYGGRTITLPIHLGISFDDAKYIADEVLLNI